MLTKKIKVLILHPYIPHYREGIFSDLAKQYDITVGHSGEIKKNKLYKQIKVPIIKIGTSNFQQSKSGRIHLQGNLKLFNQYDVIISEMNLKFIDRYFYIFLPFRKFAWVCWGLGITYPFKENSLKDYFRIKIFGMADSLIFYSHYALKFYKEKNINPNKLFVANNTLQIKYKPDFKCNKNIFLFVGTLFKEKGVSDTLDYYHKYILASKVKNQLVIIGDGVEKEELIKKVNRMSLSEYVVFIKGTSDEKILKEFYDKSIFSISLYQTGLSVLSSFGHGTPLITMHDSRTGGERFNIIDDYNGLLLKKPIDLVNVFKKADTNIDYFLKMGKNAYETYLNKASHQNMLAKIVLGVNYALKKKNLKI